MTAPARQPRAKSSGSSWQWARTAETQRALLDAAREVFVEQGFADASIAEVVERAGSSVGSLYHHFGGKSELYVALWQEYTSRRRRRRRAGRRARRRRAGVTDPFELFSAGRACLPRGQLAAPRPGDAVLPRRHAARLRGDGGAAGTSGSGQNDTLLRLSDKSFDRLYATHPDLADRRGRQGGGRRQEPAAGQHGDRRGHRVRPAAHGRRPVEAPAQGPGG